MKILRTSDLLEKSLAFVFLVVFVVFAVFFTVANQEELEDHFNSQRLALTKSLSREICYQIENKADITPKLSNILAENSVAYAVVQLRDGQALARAEGYALPVAVFEKVESEALRTEHLTLFPFKDPSGRYSLVEAAMPFYTADNNKFFLRLGFLRNTEEENLSHLRYRNILVFALILVFLASIWSVRYLANTSIRYVLSGYMTLIMLILFFASAYTIRQWYSHNWRESIAASQSMQLSKLMIPSAIRFIEENQSQDYASANKIIGENNSNYCYSAIIKDDCYVSHIDKSLVGSMVSNEEYRLSLNTDKPSIYNSKDSEIYTIMLPILRGSSRIGTLTTLWRFDEDKYLIATLRKKLSMIFVFAYVAFFIFIQLFSEEMIKRFSWLGEKESPLPSGTKSVGSETKKATLSASIFFYFSGIYEAVNRIDADDLSNSINLCFNCINAGLKKYKAIAELRTDGVLVVFSEANEQDSIFQSIEFVKEAKVALDKLEALPFSPKITIHLSNLVKLDSTNALIGDSFIDYKSIAKIQGNEIVVSQETYDILKDVINFEKLEIIIPECGKLYVYVLNDFKETAELSKVFENSVKWKKLMILRIFESSNTFDSKEKERLLKLLEESK